MLTPLICLLSVLPADEPVRVTNGDYRAEGWRMQVIGVADCLSKTPAQGLDGKPLTGIALKELEAGVDEKLSARPWSSADPGKRRILVVFRSWRKSGGERGPRCPFYFRYKSYQGHPPEPKKGRTYGLEAYEFTIPKDARTFEVPFEFAAGEWKNLATFDEKGVTSDAGFSFEARKKTVQAVTYTQSSKKTVLVDQYEGTGLIPFEYGGSTFEIGWDDASPKKPDAPKKGDSPFDFPMEMGMGMFAEKVGDKAKIMWMVHCKNHPGHKRIFTLKARSLTTIVFPLPLPLAK